MMVVPHGTLLSSKKERLIDIHYNMGNLRTALVHLWLPRYWVGKTGINYQGAVVNFGGLMDKLIILIMGMFPSAYICVKLNIVNMCVKYNPMKLTSRSKNIGIFMWWVMD
jgi:hypothetical protein